MRDRKLAVYIPIELQSFPCVKKDSSVHFIPMAGQTNKEYSRTIRIRTTYCIPKEKIIDYLLSDHYQKYRFKLRLGTK